MRAVLKAVYPSDAMIGRDSTTWLWDSILLSIKCRIGRNRFWSLRERFCDHDEDFYYYNKPVQITRSKVWFLHYWFVYAHIFVCPDLVCVCVLFCLLVVKALLARTSLLVYHVTFPKKVLESKKSRNTIFVWFFVKCLEMCFWFPFDYTLCAWWHLSPRACIN